eukprot:NODE_505_length_6682_cov_0.825394.p4 type:complete len:188 gc:universal NODE_505_length_6682_cov_0.825394:3055-2492(-)
MDLYFESVLAAWYDNLFVMNGVLRELYVIYATNPTGFNLLVLKNMAKIADLYNPDQLEKTRNYLNSIGDLDLKQIMIDKMKKYPLKNREEMTRHFTNKEIYAIWIRPVRIQFDQWLNQPITMSSIETFKVLLYSHPELTKLQLIELIKFKSALNTPNRVEYYKRVLQQMGIRFDTVPLEKNLKLIWG